MENQDVAIFGINNSEHPILDYCKQRLAAISGPKHSILDEIESQTGQMIKICSDDQIQSIGKIDKGIKFLWICDPEDGQVLKKAFESDDVKTILIERPNIPNLWELQSLDHLNVFKHKIIFGFYKRLQTEFEAMNLSIQKAVEGGAKIVYINIETVVKNRTIFEELYQDIDLIHYLSNENFKTVMASGNPDSHILITGEIQGGANFVLNIRKTEFGEHFTSAKVILDTEESFLYQVEKIDDIHKQYHKAFKHLYESLLGSNKQSDHPAGIPEATEVLRVIECIFESFDSRAEAKLKHFNPDMIEFKTVGTAKITGEGLFTPIKEFDDMALTGIFSGNTETLQEKFHKMVKGGEPIEFETTYSELITTHTSKKRIIYIPTLPSERKDNEIIEALNGGYYVLAEKPAFASVDQGIKLFNRLEKEARSRLFYGWHSILHPITRAVLDKIKSGGHGKLNVVKGWFDFPKEYMEEDHTRIYEPHQGGAGLDVFSYLVHLCLWLGGFDTELKIQDSKVKTAEYLDPKNKELRNVDISVSAKLEFKNKFVAECESNFDPTIFPRCEVLFIFEDGSQIQIKEYQALQNLIGKDINPVLMMKKGGIWRPYFEQTIFDNPDFNKSSYYHQLNFLRKIIKGEISYDAEKDPEGMMIEKNIRLGEVLEQILKKKGIVHDEMLPES